MRGNAGVGTNCIVAHRSGSETDVCHDDCAVSVGHSSVRCGVLECGRDPALRQLSQENAPISKEENAKLARDIV